MSPVRSHGQTAPISASRNSDTLCQWLFAGLLLLCIGAQAAQNSPRHFVLPAGERLKIAAFSDHVDLLEDAGGKLAIDDLVCAPTSTRFTPATLMTANIGFTDSVWWARFTLRNAGSGERRVFLRQTYPLIDYLDLYEQDGAGGWRRHSTGDRRQFSTRDVAHRDLLFPLTLPAQGERTFYLRYQSQGAIDVSLSLYSAAELVASVSREQLAYGIYFGCVVMLLVWAGLVFIAVRDRAFIAYFAYVGTFGLYMLINNGVAFQFLWPQSPRWGNASVIVLISLALIAGLQFSRMILRARDYTPKLDRAAQVLQLIAAAALAATPLLDYAQLVAPVTLLILISVVFMMILGIVSVLSGYRPARFYLLAWSSFLASSAVYLLKTFGVLPHTFFTHHSWQIGSLLEMILLSMTLSSRMNELQHQSRTDPLTLLGNRRLFDDKLPTELALARHLHRSLSLLVLDIDQFKHYNDRHGHARGDEALKAVASALHKHARKPFIACRYGGEEFAVILPGIDHDTAAMLAERLRKTVQDALSGDLGITVSVGFACTSQMGVVSADKLFEAADSALYSAKQQGRNRVVAFVGRRNEDLPAARDEENRDLSGLGVERSG